MVYDIIKILKKCLSFWYIFLATILIGVMSLLLVDKPLKTFKGGFCININYINQEEILKKNGDLNYYHYLSKILTDKICKDYLKDNLLSICKDLNIPNNELKVDIYKISDKFDSAFQINVEHYLQNVSTSVNDYIKVDLINYMNEVAISSIPEPYLLTSEPLVYDSVSPRCVITNIALNMILVDIMLLVFEVFVIGILVLKKNKILFDCELESDFKECYLIKDYDKNPDALKYVISNINANTLLIGESTNLKQLANNDSMIYRDIKDVDIFEKFDINPNSAIVEIIKETTESKKINNIIEGLKLRKVKDIYLITKSKEK